MRHSAKLDKIAAQLAIVQSRVRPVARDAVNDESESRYTTIVALLDALRQPLTDAKLSYAQSATAEMLGPFPFVRVTTLLTHETSGQWIESDLMLPIGVVTTQQGAAAVTFAKRMGLASICGVVSENEDKDAQGQTPEPASKTRTTMILKAERPKGIAEHFKQTFEVDGQRFRCRDAALASRLVQSIGQPVTLTLRGYADGEVEIVGMMESQS